MEVRKHTARGKGKAPEKKQGRQRKQLQKTKYIFVLASKKTEEYKNYFNHDPVVERHLLGLDLLVCLFSVLRLFPRAALSDCLKSCRNRRRNYEMWT